MSLLEKAFSPKEVESASHETIETIQHAKCGYQNAQEIIKFVDTKNGVLAGFSGIAVGAVLQALKEVATAEKLQPAILTIGRDHPIVWNISVLFCILSIICGLFSLGYCASSLLAKGPKSHIPSTVLFPFYSGTPASFTVVDNMGKGMKPAQILEEYRVQIRSVGQILFWKVKRHRVAGMFFFAQILLLAFCGLFLLWLIWA